MTKDVVITAVDTAKDIAANPDVQHKVVSMLDALQNGAVIVGNQVVKYTPDVINAALDIVRINGLQQALHCLLSLVVLITACNISKKQYPIANFNTGNDSAMFCIVSWFFILISSIIISIIAFDVWNWVMIFEPKLYIAKEIIDKVMK